MRAGQQPIVDERRLVVYVFTRESANLRPDSSFSVWSFAQKCMKNSRGSSFSMWLCSAVTSIPLPRSALITGFTSVGIGSLLRPGWLACRHRPCTRSRPRLRVDDKRGQRHATSERSARSRAPSEATHPSQPRSRLSMTTPSTKYILNPAPAIATLAQDTVPCGSRTTPQPLPGCPPPRRVRLRHRHPVPGR
jgi:hypothetical protein